jgi:ankyrin repeat protein
MAKKGKKSNRLVRGQPLIDRIIGFLQSDDSPIGEEEPLSLEQILALENQCGVAFSPTMRALLLVDTGYLEREFGWFDNQRSLLARPVMEVIGDHAGEFAQYYQELVDSRFPGLAIELDQGSDSMRFLYLGYPDAYGEYPVVFIDHDDMPMLGIEEAGIDVYLAKLFEILSSSEDDSHDLVATKKSILGSTDEWEMGINECWIDLPPPVLAPAPGTGLLVSAKEPKKTASPQKKLTDKQLAKALCEKSSDVYFERLSELIAIGQERAVPKKVWNEALMHAVLGTNPLAIQALLKAGASPDSKDSYGCALSRAATTDLSCVKSLIEAGANPNGLGIHQQSSLFAAIDTDNLDIARYLLEKGADPNHQDHHKLVPLHAVASEQASLEMMSLLLSHGALPDGVGGQRSPLHEAVESGRAELVEKLLVAGADVNRRQDYLQATSLHLAFERGRDDIAALLIRNGADRSLRDERGIDFLTIYDDQGNDIRECTIAFQPCSESQQLIVKQRIAVLNHHGFAHSFPPLQTAIYWQRIMGLGVAGGALFSPSESRSMLLSADELRTTKTSGVFEIVWKFEVQGVASAFLRLLAHALVGRQWVFTGAGVVQAFRTIAISIRGTHPETPETPTTTIPHWFTTHTEPLLAFPTTLPFELTLAEGANGLSITTKKARKKSEEAQEVPVVGNQALALVYEMASAWLALHPLWPSTSDVPQMIQIIQTSSKGRTVQFAIKNIDPNAVENEPFPFDRTLAFQALHNCMLALHDRIPLEKVVLSLSNVVPKPHTK